MSDEEENRLDALCQPLLDLFLRFERAFARIAIDRLNVSDEDAEALAVIMEKTGTDSGSAFAYLMRYVKTERVTRLAFHMAAAVFESQRSVGLQPGMISMQHLGEAYRKIHGGSS